MGAATGGDDGQRAREPPARRILPRLAGLGGRGSPHPTGARVLRTVTLGALADASV